MKRVLLIAAGTLLLTLQGFSQPCGSTVSTFPYVQNFNADAGGWIAGGVSSDWAWGTVSKSIITSSSNCWTTGGLNGSSYNNGEDSWLMSPCFDLSSLANPEISFNLFWETEQVYDGASFEYSTDGGDTWRVLGNSNASKTCQGFNWFNTGAITYLGNRFGWSGTKLPNNGSCLGGNGSVIWRTAWHNLATMRGETNVRFRFLFGAGTTCNNFNGFAVDDIRIGESEISEVSILSSCINRNTVQFSAVNNCLGIQSWNFGDPASGANNTDTTANPVHQFNNTGTYTVTLATRDSYGSPDTVTREIVVIAAVGQTDWPGRCDGVYDAKLFVTASGSNTGYFYNWDTNPSQSGDTVRITQPGDYTVTISALNACATSVKLNVPVYRPLANRLDIKDADCAGNKGSITANISGGRAPYRYLWSTGSTASSIQNLLPGSYEVEVRDSSNCVIQTQNIVVGLKMSGLPVDLGRDMSICDNETISLTPGNFSSYQWQDGSVGSTFTVTSPGTYNVAVVNNLGCMGNDEILVYYDCSDLYFPGAFTPNSDARNDGFSALGTQVIFARNYRLDIFNRYGQLVFTSTDPLQKWDGSVKGSLPQTGSYVWMANYLLNGIQRSRRGTVLIIR